MLSTFHAARCVRRWQAADGLPGLANMYLAAMDALSPIAPQALFFLAGCGQAALTQSPGDGFATDANTIKALNLSDPTSFFKTLLLRPYVNQARGPPLLPPCFLLPPRSRAAPQGPACRCAVTCVVCHTSPEKWWVLQRVRS